MDEFCAVVLEAANITTWLQDLFAEVEVGNEDTYPDPEDVEKVIVRVAELLELGNETAPADIRDAWLTATAAFVETGRLAAVDYDIRELSQDDLRDARAAYRHAGRGRPRGGRRDRRYSLRGSRRTASVTRRRGARGRAELHRLATPDTRRRATRTRNGAPAPQGRGHLPLPGPFEERPHHAHDRGAHAAGDPDGRAARGDGELAVGREPAPCTS